ncbi:MAG TPA: GntR family transcriptional regulator [Chloroflexota bacterium]|nr:GntR family transcriptional regulator [Chloroflexota bacterium]
MNEPPPSPWDAAPVRDRALRNEVLDHVLTALREGRLPPGERVHEVHLARALGVSLSPVREALFRLSDRGVLEHRPRRGFYVKTIGEAETRQIYTFRALLESFAAAEITARCAAQGREAWDGAGALTEMRAAIDGGERAGRAGDRMGVGAWNARFHDALVRLAGHSLLERAWALLAPAEWLLIPTWTFAPETITAAEMDDWVARHRRLLHLLESGDPAAAGAAARAHVLEAGDANLRKRFQAPPTGR